MLLDRYEYVQFEIIVPEKGDIEIVYIKAAKSCTSSCDARSNTTSEVPDERPDRSAICNASHRRVQSWMLINTLIRNTHT
jgi:hypothetical protein